MNKFKTLSAAALVLAGTASAWEVSGAVSYGACFIDGAPNAYKYPKGEEFFPDAKTTEPLAVALGASFGRLAVAASYAQRYELYSEAGKVHDFSLLGRPLLWSHNAWELRGEAGVAVSRAPAPPAFMFGKEGPTHDWTAVVGADLGFQPFTWLSSRAGISYRERPQVINFTEGEWYSYYGTVKSPAIDVNGPLPPRPLAFPPRRPLVPTDLLRPLRLLPLRRNQSKRGLGYRKRNVRYGNRGGRFAFLTFTLNR